MSTNQTKNLKLHSWAPLDRFTREEFNDNWAGIDAAWGDLDGRILADVEALSAEASERKSADTTLQKNIDAEAATRKTNDDALQTKITAEGNTRASADTALANRATALEKRAATLETGRALIATGTYRGNGAENASNSQDITVGFKPKAVFVRAETEYTVETLKRFAFATDKKTAKVNAKDALTLTDTGFTVWNIPNGCLLNSLIVDYFYLALG